MAIKHEFGRLREFVSQNRGYEKIVSIAHGLPSGAWTVEDTTLTCLTTSLKPLLFLARGVLAHILFLIASFPA